VAVATPTSECVDALLAASRALMSAAARSIVEVERDLTLVQWRALVVVATRGPQRAGDLAEQLGVRPSSLTGLCDRLEAKGLVRRDPAPASRREVLVVATADGERIVRSVMRRRRREIERTIAALSPQQCHAIADAMGAFARAAGEAPDDGWRLGWVT
jgi:DNA-binding MarR family transcriptional regulator